MKGHWRFCLAWSGWRGECSEVRGEQAGPQSPSLRGAARRSNPDFLAPHDGLLRCARNDGGPRAVPISICKRSFTISRLDLPEASYRIFSTLKTEGAGNAGCTLHPRSRMQSWIEAWLPEAARTRAPLCFVARFRTILTMRLRVARPNIAVKHERNTPGDLQNFRPLPEQVPEACG
jgi:hypothetical protein